MTTQHELLARAIESLRSAKNHVAATAGAQSMLDGFGKKKQRPADRELAEINALIDEFDNLPPAVAAEPVAWQYRELIYDVAIVDWSDCDKSEFDRFNEEPWQYETRALYTEQPAALSDDLRKALVSAVGTLENETLYEMAAIVRAFLDSAK